MSAVTTFIEHNKLSSHGQGIVSLLSSKKVLELVAICRSENIGIWGLNAYDLHPGGMTIYSNKCTIFFSDTSESDSLDKAANYLNKNSDENIGYDVVFRDDPGDIRNFIQMSRLSKYGMTLIDKGAFRELIAMAKAKGVDIKGFETFFLLGGLGVRPSMELSPDFSTLSKEERYEKMNDFLSKLTEECLGFEIYLS